ncbi:MAG TPA: tRNA (guanosine(46)-N7)-methyltransferase TrmB [Arenibacter sp.]|nr:tRNA (guanosine(46)-N7)-methyltransferase TrmB [Arenibacter sp.]
MVIPVGSKNKLKRFKENETFANVIQPGREEIAKGQFPYKGKWNEFFGNDHPLVLELGCGKGEYTIGLAKQNPDKNYIGIDIKGARFWRGAKTGIQENIKNAAFLRSQIELIDGLFDENEVSEIWITFPDPQIKYKRTKHRLTNMLFLEKYKVVLKPEGTINLKTDSEFMHGYTLGLLHGMGLEVLHANHDVYRNEGSPKEVLGIQTFYEKQYLERGKPITYIKFRVQ